jgi:hypothetical protein
MVIVVATIVNGWAVADLSNSFSVDFSKTLGSQHVLLGAACDDPATIGLREKWNEPPSPWRSLNSLSCVP